MIHVRTWTQQDLKNWGYYDTKVLKIKLLTLNI